MLHALLAHPIAFAWGVYEFRLIITSSFEDIGRDDAYDWGREFAHVITLRRFEP